MAKWRITTDLETINTNSRAGFKNFIKGRRPGKSIFKVDRDTLEDEGPANRDKIKLGDEVRFNNKPDADNYAKEIKDHFEKLENNPKINNVIISKHLCPHEQEDFQYYDCRTDERAQFQLVLVKGQRE